MEDILDIIIMHVPLLGTPQVRQEIQITVIDADNDRIKEKTIFNH